MRTIIAQIKISPGREAEAEQALKKMAASVEGNEPKAVAYIVHRDPKDPGSITFFEVYSDDEALAHHGGTEHMTAFRGHFSTVFDPGAVKITRLERIAGFTR